MNAIACIKTRRSVRKFKNEQIKDEELIQVLEAGTWSPTSMGAQHPHIFFAKLIEIFVLVVSQNFVSLHKKRIIKTEQQ